MLIKNVKFRLWQCQIRLWKAFLILSIYNFGPEFSDNEDCGKDEVMHFCCSKTYTAEENKRIT